jgi:hypothetical protein
MKCEREQQVIAATRNGMWTSSLRAHLLDCALCAQTEWVAASLQENAATLERQLDLPPAAMVWRRAQARRRVDALQRATRRPFVIVGVLSGVYAAVLLLWGFLQLPQSVSRLLVTPPGLNGNVALTGAVLSGVLVIVGSCVFALETRR